jgi:hypothetical protein
MHLQLPSSVEVLKTLGNTDRHGLLTLTNPDCGTLVSIQLLAGRWSCLTSWVEVLLVWLILSVWVADLLADVVLLRQDVVADAGKVSVLQIGIEVDLNDTVADGIGELLLGGTGSTVEDKEDWLVLLGSDRLLDVLLVLAEELWVELDVSWLVDTVDVSETSGDGEVWGDWGEGLVDGENILWLGVEGVVVNILVVDTILLTTGDTDFLQQISILFLLLQLKDAHHLEPLLHWGSALQVLSGGLDVPLNLLLGEIDHVGREQRLAVLGEVLLISIEEAIQPWEKLLGAVIGVEDDWDAV